MLEDKYQIGIHLRLRSCSMRTVRNMASKRGLAKILQVLVQSDIPHGKPSIRCFEALSVLYFAMAYCSSGSHKRERYIDKQIKVRNNFQART